MTSATTDLWLPSQPQGITSSLSLPPALSHVQRPNHYTTSPCRCPEKMSHHARRPQPLLLSSVGCQWLCLVLYSTLQMYSCIVVTAHTRSSALADGPRDTMPVNIMPNSAHVFSAIAIFKAGNLGEWPCGSVKFVGNHRCKKKFLRFFIWVTLFTFLTFFIFQTFFYF